MNQSQRAENHSHFVRAVISTQLLPLHNTMPYLDWTITYHPSKEEISGIAHTSPDELCDYIADAFRDGRCFSVYAQEHDPTPQYLYDNDGGEPPMSSDERWRAAQDEHIQLHS